MGKTKTLRAVGGAGRRAGEHAVLAPRGRSGLHDLRARRHPGPARVTSGRSTTKWSWATLNRRCRRKCRSGWASARWSRCSACKRRLKDGDQILLISPHLTNALSVSEIKELVTSTNEPTQAIELLRSDAIRRRLEGTISCVLLNVGNVMAFAEEKISHAKRGMLARNFLAAGRQLHQRRAHRRRHRAVPAGVGDQPELHASSTTNSAWPTCARG